MAVPQQHVQIYKVRCRVLLETLDQRWYNKVFYVTEPDPNSIRKFLYLYYDDYAFLIDYHIYDITPVND